MCFGANRKTKMATLASVWLIHFRLLFCYGWTESKDTWQEERSQLLLPRCFFANRKTKMSTLASVWLIHFDFFSAMAEKNSRKLDREARSQCPLTSLCFLGRSENQDGHPGLSLADIYSTSFLLQLKRIQGYLIRSKISMSSTQFVFFRPIKKPRWPPWPLIGWYILEFFSAWLNRIQGYLTGSNTSTSTTKFVFLWRWLKNQDGRPLIYQDIFDFLSATAEWNSRKLDRKQDTDNMTKWGPQVRDCDSLNLLFVQLNLSITATQWRSKKWPL